MKLAITLPHYDYSLEQNKAIEFGDILESTKIASQAGFDIGYISDHPTLDIEKYGGDNTPYRSFEAMTTLAALSTQIKDMSFGSLVLCEALRNPVMTAFQAQTIADISQSEFTLGIGAGWYEPDYEILGQEMYPIGERMSRITESLQIMRSLLEGKQTTFDGKYYSTKDATLKTPGNDFKKNVSLMVGGKGDRLLSIVARYADAWNACWAWNPQTYSNRLESLKKSCEKYSREYNSIYKSLGLYCVVAQDQSSLEKMFEDITKLSPKGVSDGKTLETWRDSHLVGTVDEVAEQIANWANLGVDELVVNPGFAPFHVGSNEIIEQIGVALNKAKSMADI